MRRAVKKPRRPWLGLACALLGLVLIAGGASRSTYYFCNALQQAHGSPCCKHAEKSAPHGPALAPVCCEQRAGATAASPVTAPGVIGPVFVAAPSVTALLPDVRQLPADSLLAAPRWPIRAGPIHASDFVVELQVLLS